MRRLVTLSEAATHLGVSDRTVRNYIGEGYFAVYKRPGQRSYLVDLAEVDAWVATDPPSVYLRKDRFGPKAKIIELRPQAVVVPKAER